MADLDDGPGQIPLPREQVRETAARLLKSTPYDLVLTHGPRGEYTRHLRHTECCRAVMELWQSGGLNTKCLWLFAYDDGDRAYLPRVRADADRRDRLKDEVWREKLHVITDLYAFEPYTWEARTTPREEGFWCFDSPRAAAERVAKLQEQQS